MLEHAYIWFDFFCVPQSKSAEDERKNARRSLRSYIEHSDFMLILVPGCVHTSEVDPRTKHKLTKGFRTWRLSSRNVLELYISFLKPNRSSSYASSSCLVVQGTEGEPRWQSPFECSLLSVGQSKFVDGFDDRSVYAEILSNAIDSKVMDLVRQRKVELMRLYICMKVWWTRDLPVQYHENLADMQQEEVRKRLQWSSRDGMWIDRSGISILVYLALLRNVRALRDCLQAIQELQISHRNRIYSSTIKPSSIVASGS